MENRTLPRRALAEAIGTGMLVTVVVGSGIAASRLSPDDVGLQLLQNALATAAGLTAIILAVGPVSGAHLNPAVSLVDRLLGGLTTREFGVYAGSQIAGGLLGSVLANLMFSEPAIALATTERDGFGLLLAEVVATAGLVLVIYGVVRSGGKAVAAAVGIYIGAAYFFTASTGFANPAVTMARTITDTFAGIRPQSAPAFIGAQVIGAGVGLAVVLALYPRVRQVAGDVVVPHGGSEDAVAEVDGNRTRQRD